jgi:hypothetical protein
MVRDREGRARLTALALSGTLLASGCSALAVAPVRQLPRSAAVPLEVLVASIAVDGAGLPTGGGSAVTPPSTAPGDPDGRRDGPGRQKHRPDLRPRPRPGPFSMDISSRRDFVSQATNHWCVAAAMLTMINIVEAGRPDARAGTQKRLYALGRRLSDQRKLGPIGIKPEGWAEGLNRRGIGPYIVHAAPTRGMAIRIAARALRMTGRPVGLVTWRGAHSWVMHGFEATADPAWDRDFRVTHVQVHDVWYPRISSIWGPSRPPDARIHVDALGADYLPFRRPGRRHPKWDGRFLLILPVLPEETDSRG